MNRAPLWMQRHGLEWLYRLAKNPGKYTKVATLPLFVLRVLKRQRLPSSAATPTPHWVGARTRRVGTNTLDPAVYRPWACAPAGSRAPELDGCVARFTVPAGKRKRRGWG